MVPIPECCVCLQPYEDRAARMPRILTCGHSICHDCSEQLIAASLIASKGRQDPDTSPGHVASVLAQITSTAGPTASPIGVTTNLAAQPGTQVFYSGPNPSTGAGNVFSSRLGAIRCPECKGRTRVSADGARGLPRNIELLRVVAAIRAETGLAGEGGLAAGSPVRKGGGAGNPKTVWPAAASDILGTSSELDSAIGTPDAEGAVNPLVTERLGPGVTKLVDGAPPVTTSESGGSQLKAPVEKGGGGRAGNRNVGSPPPEYGQQRSGGGPVAGSPCTVEEGDLNGHQDTVSAMAVVGGRWVVSGSMDKTIMVWDTAKETGQAALAVLVGHQQRVTALAAAAEAAQDNEAEAGIGSGDIGYTGDQEREEGTGFGAGTHQVVGNGAVPYVFFSGDVRGEVRAWALAMSAGGLNPATASSPGAGNSGIGTPGRDPQAGGRGRSPRGGAPQRSVTVTCMAVWDAHVDWRYFGVMTLALGQRDEGGGAHVLYSGGGDWSVRAWEVDASGRAGGAADVGTTDMSGGKEGEGRGEGLLVAARQVGEMKGHKGPVTALVVDFEILYSGSWDGSIRIWWRRDHTPFAILQPGPGPGVRALCLAGGDQLVAAHDDGSLTAWREGEPDGTVSAAHRSVTSCLCSGPGWVYSGAWDGSIAAWAAGGPLAPPPRTVQEPSGVARRKEAAVQALLFAGGRLYSAHGGRDIKVWRPAAEQV